MEGDAAIVAVRVRPAREGEEFMGLDDQQRKLDARVQVVTCNGRAVAIAGVMGSKESGVTSTTTSIWLESAMFSAVRVRQSARAMGLRTDASSRFEKGLPLEITLASSQRAVTLLEGLFPAFRRLRELSALVTLAQWARDVMKLSNCAASNR